MRLEQDIRQRAYDGKFEVWQRIDTRPPGFWDASEDRGYLRPESRGEWMPVAVFWTYNFAIRFCNACFTRNSALAPAWAGDGSGSSLSEPWIAALSR